MKRLPEGVLLEIARCPHESLRGLASRLCVSTHTIQRIRRLPIPSGASLEEIQAAVYKPPMHVESVKPPINFAAVIEQRASGLSIKDCWKVYRKDRPNGFSLTRFSALVKEHAEAPGGYVPVGGPVAVPVNTHCERIHWPESIEESGDDTDDNPSDGILSVSDNGSSIKVRFGELVVGLRSVRDLCDGANVKGVTANGFRFMRATHGLRAVIVEGDAMISTAALAWLEGQGIDLYIDTPHGIRVFGAAAPSAIRKAQYATDGLSIAKRLVLQKFIVCKDLAMMPPFNHECLLNEVNAANSLEALRLVEARYSLVYWQRVSPVFLKHPASFPTTWRTWNGTRTSPISGVNSSSTHPVNSCLNYAYAILASKYELAAAVK